MPTRCRMSGVTGRPVLTSATPAAPRNTWPLWRTHPASRAMDVVESGLQFYGIGWVVHEIFRNRHFILLCFSNALPGCPFMSVAELLGIKKSIQSGLE